MVKPVKLFASCSNRCSRIVFRMPPTEEFVSAAICSIVNPSSSKRRTRRIRATGFHLRTPDSVCRRVRIGSAAFRSGATSASTFSISAISDAVLIFGNVLRYSAGTRFALSSSLQAQMRRLPSNTTHWPFSCAVMIRSPGSRPVFAIFRARSCTSSYLSSLRIMSDSLSVGSTLMRGLSRSRAMSKGLIRVFLHRRVGARTMLYPPTTSIAEVNRSEQANFGGWIANS